MKLLTKAVSYLAVASLLAMGSCASESPWSGSSDTDGKISLQLLTDATVYTSTRADDKVSPVRPNGDDFKIRLESTDGSYQKEWATLSSFNKEEGFPKGVYNIEASYGDIDKEGFTNPYYLGTVENISVKAGEESSVSIEATLANSMVSVRYTDSFKSMFGQYSATLTSTEGSPVSFVQNEERPAYVKPGNISVSFVLTNQSGKSVTVSPATFTAEPRRHYIVTANVLNDQTTGDAVLSVEFTEDVVTDAFEIVLDEDFWEAPAPTVTLKGLNNATDVDTFEGVSLGEINPEFHVFAHAGIKSAKFYVTADAANKLPAFGGEVDLVMADDITKSLIEESKLDCYGLFRNPDKVAVVNMKRFIESLQPGNYTMKLEVVDSKGIMVTQEELPVVKTTVRTVEFAVEPAESPNFMDNEVSVVVSTNYAGAKDGFSFKSLGKEGGMCDATIKSVTAVSTPTPAPTRASLDYKFKYTLETEDINDSQWSVETNYPNKSAQTVKVDVNMPKYRVEADAFATRVMFKIIPEDTNQLENILNNVKIINGSTRLNSSSRDVAAGVIVVKDFNPGTSYDNIVLSLGSDVSRNKLPVSFTTEAAAQIPNGDFSASTQTINISGVQVGGQYRVSPVDYAHKSSIVRDTPNQWATINALTCYEGSSNKNTWFLVPSTFDEGGAVIVRTVGYNHNGTTPRKSGGTFNTKYYCENAPSDDQLEKTSGELFLGTYSFDGTEHRTDGIGFSNRPDYVSFNYMYTPYNNEYGEMYVKLLDGDKVVAAGSAEIKATGNQNMVSMSVPVSEYKFGDKVTSIQICFRSTASGMTPSVNIPSGSDLNEGQGLGNKTIDANKYHAFAMGSELKIDNVRLGYGEIQNAARSSRRKSK